MEKKNKVIFFVILFFTLCVIGTCIYFINKDKNINNSDALNFRNEYMNYNDKDYSNVYISEQNTIKYKTEEEIIDILKKGKGIIYFGYPTNDACRSIVSIISELGNELKTDIYYLNIENMESVFKVEDKSVIKIKDGSENYYKIVNLLSDYLEDYYIDGYNTFEKRIVVPTVVAVNNGKITGFYAYKEDNDLDNEELENIRKEIKKIINNNNVEICTQKTC